MLPAAIADTSLASVGEANTLIWFDPFDSIGLNKPLRFAPLSAPAILSLGNPLAWNLFLAWSTPMPLHLA